MASKFRLQITDARDPILHSQVLEESRIQVAWFGAAPLRIYGGGRGTRGRARVARRVIVEAAASKPSLERSEESKPLSPSLPRPSSFSAASSDIIASSDAPF